MTASASPQRRRLPWRRRLLFIGVLGVLLLVFLEVGSFFLFSLLQREWFSYAQIRAQQQQAARLEAEQAGLEDAPQDFINLRIHPYLGYSHANRYLEQSIRSPQAETVVIGIFGGSVAGNFYDKGREALIALLGESPAFRNKHIVVQSHTLGGFKQPQQLMTLSYLLALGGHFDIVINLDGFNEAVLPVTDNLPMGAHPLYPRAWWQLVDVRDPGLKRLIGEITYLRNTRRQWAEAFLQSPAQYSIACQLAWKVGDRSLRASIIDVSRSLQLYRPDRSETESRLLESLGYTDENVPAKLAEFWARCSTQMHRVCQAYGIKYLHYLQPNQYVGDKPMGSEERRVAMVEDDPYVGPVRAGYPHLRAQERSLVAAGVQFGDLTAIFADEARPVYTDSCCHLNELGCEIIAARVARDIIASF